MMASNSKRARRVASILEQNPEANYAVNLSIKFELSFEVKDEETQAPLLNSDPLVARPRSIILEDTTGLTYSQNSLKSPTKSPKKPSGKSPRTNTGSPSKGSPSKGPSGTNNTSNSRKTKNSMYAHYEFIPPQDDRTTKADVVVHSRNTAKVFHDAEAKSITPESTDGFATVGFKHTFPIGVDSALLDDLYDDRMTFRVWDTVDRVSSRARFDRPKPILADSNKKNARGPLETSGRLSKAEVKASSVENSVQEEREQAANAHAEVLTEITALSKSRVTEDGTGALLCLDTRGFFSGDTKLVEQYRFTPEESGLEHLRAIKVTMELDRQLLSPMHKKRLQPLSISIDTVSGLPTTPVGLEELSKKCLSPYVIVNFEGVQKERLDSKDGSRSENMAWGRRHIVLLGRFEKEKLERYLKLQKVRVELHDRDRKPHDAAVDKLFGRDHAAFADFDAAIGLSLASPHSEIFNPYGIVDLDLSDLLTGTRTLTFESSVLPCALPTPHSRAMTNKLDAAGHDIGPLHAGHYVEAGTSITIRVELVVPYKIGEVAEQDNTHSININHDKSPFLRILLSFPTASSYQVLQRLISRFQSANECRAAVDEIDETEDVLSGWVVASSQIHVVVVEGLATSPHLRLVLNDAESGQGGVIFSHSSARRHPHRLYTEFGTLPKMVLLSCPSDNLLSHPEIYVRGGRGWKCRNILLTLQRLGARPSLHMNDICSEALWPSPADICLLDTTYGVSDPKLIFPTSQNEEETNAQEKLMVSLRGRATARVQSFNESYINAIKSPSETIDFVQLNKSLPTVSPCSRDRGNDLSEDVILADGEDGDIYMYSSQSRNSVSVALQRQPPQSSLEATTAPSTPWLSTRPATVGQLLSGTGALNSLPATASVAAMEPTAGGIHNRWYAASANRVLLPERAVSKEAGYNPRVVDLGLWRDKQSLNTSPSKEKQNLFEDIAMSRLPLPWESRKLDFRT